MILCIDLVYQSSTKISSPISLVWPFALSFPRIDTTLQLLNRNQDFRATQWGTENSMFAVVDASNYYGGYPEDIAVSAKNLAWGGVIVTSPGDDAMLYTMASYFWRTYECSIPVYRSSLSLI